MSPRVSIRARFMSRAIRYRKGRHERIRQCFNPRPVYEPGDTFPDRERLGRAKGFNPRPVYEPGDTCHDQLSGSGTDCFNPRPVYEPGDTAIGLVLYDDLRGFNPRPVYEPGDTIIGRPLGQSGGVSIRARFMSRAIPSICDMFGVLWVVSIRARFMSRAIRLYPCGCVVDSRFQSAPGL